MKVTLLALLVAASAVVAGQPAPAAPAAASRPPANPINWVRVRQPVWS